MPVKINQKTTYHLDVEIVSLQIKVALDADDQTLRIIYKEIEDFYKALADMVGAIPIAVPEHRRQSTGGVSPVARTKLLEYANTHTDFTIKGASEALNIPEQTLWAAANKLVADDVFVKTQVLGGIAHIYAIKKQRIPVLPKGKEPFPLRNPEREKMEALRG